MNATMQIQEETFKRGSRTYFNSSIFFPLTIRRDVTALYAFVRVADDLVDTLPQQTAEFERFRRRYCRALRGEWSGDLIVDGFVELAGRKHFAPEWTESFLHSMELDLLQPRFKTSVETLGYIYGSAEVIGLMMARILDLPEESFHHACMLGRAMQYINFIRDLSEDERLGRSYLPYENTALGFLGRDEAHASPEAFCAFLRREIDRYFLWQREGEAGFRFIPRRYLVAIKTASDMYKWTAGEIYRDPFVVFERKVKPRKPRILLRALLNLAAGLNH